MKKTSVRSGRFCDRRRDLSESGENTLLFGHVVKPHGLNGDLRVNACDGRSRNLLFAEKVEIVKDGLKKNFFIEKAVCGSGGYLLSLQGINNCEEAEIFRKAEVRLFREDLPALKEDEFYLVDALGAEVVEGNGGHIGILERIEDTAAVPLLVVLKEEEEILIPASDPFIRDWNSEERRLTVDIPDGMPRYSPAKKKNGRGKRKSLDRRNKKRRP